MPKSAVSIKVVGIGGCGCNVLDTMIEHEIGAADYIAINTDEQALESSKASAKLQIGRRVTAGHGTGSDPKIGREAALEGTEEITEMLTGADMVFIVAGLGGGTGTGAAPVIASLAKQVGALTVATPIKPFSFEGPRRSRTADEGLDALVENVDTAIVIQNENALSQVEPGTGFFDGFQVAHEIVSDTLRGITGILSDHGVMNTDFSDLKAVLEDAGMAAVGTAQRTGRDAAMQAARDALASPVIAEEGLVRASKVLVNITGSSQFGMHDATEALQLIQREVSSDSDVILGVVQDDSLGEMVRVLLIASGFTQQTFQLRPENEGEALPPPEPSKSGWESEPAVDLASGALPEMVPEEPDENFDPDADTVPFTPAEPAGEPVVAVSEHDDGDDYGDRRLEVMPPPAAADQEADPDGQTRIGFFGWRSRR